MPEYMTSEIEDCAGGRQPDLNKQLITWRITYEMIEVRTEVGPVANEQAALAGQSTHPVAAEQSAQSIPFITVGRMPYKTTGLKCPHDIATVWACNDVFPESMVEAKE